MTPTDCTSCLEHTGIRADISNLKDGQKAQWGEIKDVKNKVDKIYFFAITSTVGIFGVLIISVINLLARGN